MSFTIESTKQAIVNMEETLLLCDEAKAAGYPGASREIVEATRKLTQNRLREYRQTLAKLMKA